MNADLFISYLNNPKSLDKNSSNELAGLIQQYPYFQTAHLLYLKSLHLQKSVQYPDQLKIAASYVNDRKKLYQLVMQEDLQKQIKNIEAQSEEDNKITDISPLEEQILQEAINATIQIEVKKEPNEEPNEEGLKEKPPVNLVKDAKPAPERREDVSTPRSFNQWLKSFNHDSLPLGKQETEDPSIQNDLIHEFIRKRPRIGDGPAETSRGDTQPFFSPIATAKLGLIDDESFVTETLAKIYEAQGYHLKAKTAYEMLSLKYPEKKTTFVTRIKSLKSLLQETTKSKSKQKGNS